MKKRILIVDYQWTIRNSISSGLRHEGFQVDDSSNAEQALFKLNESQFDVLLTDIQMPNVNGCILATIVRELHPQIKIIFMSAHDFNEIHVKYRELRNYPQLSKPFKIAQLYNLLNVGGNTI